MRDYGLGDYTKYIIGVPHLKQVIKDPLGHQLALPICPHCGITCLCEIEVILENLPMLTARWAIGTYLSCPACPWASPMIARPIDSLPDWMFG